MTKRQDAAFTRLEDALAWIAENARFREHHANVEAEVLELRSEVAALKSQIARLTEKPRMEIRP